MTNTTQTATTNVTATDLVLAQGGQVAFVDDTTLSVECPADYDPATITAEDILHDPAITVIADATRIAGILNNYDDTAADANVWNDVISSLPEYDETATWEADESNAGNIVVLADGTVIRYAPERGEWVARA